MSERARKVATLVLLVAALVWSADRVGFFSDGVYDKALRNLRIFGGDFWPPDLDRDILRELLRAVVETVQMAYLGTALGTAVAVPLAVLASRSLTGAATSAAVRTFLAVVRTVPTLLWALVFIVMVGLGPVAGVLGLAAYTVGYLGKLYSEALEAVDPDVLEAVRATGASKWQVVRHAVLPETGNALASHVLFLFEYNVRAGSIVGLVGAGGIGFYLVGYMQLFQYDRLATALLMLLAVVLATEALGRFVRKRFIIGRAAPE